jgi:hypothetical protein
MPIDLNDYVALRGAGSPADRRSAVIVLAPAHTQLQLRLPEGSLAGQYRVRLLDERNLPVRQAKQPSRDGQRLTVTLDLRAVAPKNYRLEIFHPGEPPALYQVQLAGQR